VKEIRLGQKTAIFLKNRENQILESTSFSLIYSDRTLDIICKDKREFDVWVTGLKSLTIDPQQIDLTDDSHLMTEEEKIIVTFKGSTTIVNKREGSSDSIFA
jgi:hypothetical protein